LLEQNIKKLLEGHFLFYGLNLGLKNDFKEKIKTLNKKNEVLIFNQEEILKNSESFLGEIKNISLFQKEKIFIIDQINDKFLEIFETNSEIIEEQNIYLFSENLEKKSKIRNIFENSKKKIIVPCYEDNELSIKKIIQEKLYGYEGLNNDTINLIQQNCGVDRVKIKNEIEKIKLYFENKKIIAKDLQELLDPMINESFNLLRDASLLGNKNQTNKLLSDTVFPQEKNIYYLSLINQRLQRLKDVYNNNKGNNLENVVSNLKPPIFWKDKANFIAQVKKWNKSKINWMIKETHNLEIKLKTESGLNKNMLIKKLIVDLCKIANA